MKALLINGSPHERGCTYTALSELARTLEAEGIETEIIQAGARTTHGCIACGKCRETGKCVFDDVVNETATCRSSARAARTESCSRSMRGRWRKSSDGFQENKPGKSKPDKKEQTNEIL